MTLRQLHNTGPIAQLRHSSCAPCLQPCATAPSACYNTSLWQRLRWLSTRHPSTCDNGTPSPHKQSHSTEPPRPGARPISLETKVCTAQCDAASRVAEPSTGGQEPAHHHPWTIEQAQPSTRLPQPHARLMLGNRATCSLARPSHPNIMVAHAARAASPGTCASGCGRRLRPNRRRPQAQRARLAPWNAASPLLTAALAGGPPLCGRAA
jgi:hypothetical protein